jgi:hypothetical protein
MDTAIQDCGRAEAETEPSIGCTMRPIVLRQLTSWPRFSSCVMQYEAYWCSLYVAILRHSCESACFLTEGITV